MSSALSSLPTSESLPTTFFTVSTLSYFRMCFHKLNFWKSIGSFDSASSFLMFAQCFSNVTKSHLLECISILVKSLNSPRTMPNMFKSAGWKESTSKRNSSVLNIRTARSLNFLRYFFMVESGYRFFALSSARAMMSLLSRWRSGSLAS